MEQASARCCLARMKRTSRWIHLVVRVRHGIRTHPPENAQEKKFYCNSNTCRGRFSTATGQAYGYAIQGEGPPACPWAPLACFVEASPCGFP